MSAIINVTSTSELTVEPLTKEELQWVKKLARLLEACPSDRLELVTIGDPNLTVTDKTHPNYSNIDDCEWDGCALAEISFFGGPNIAGMCG